MNAVDVQKINTKIFECDERHWIKFLTSLVNSLRRSYHRLLFGHSYYRSYCRLLFGRSYCRSYSRSYYCKVKLVDLKQQNWSRRTYLNVCKRRLWLIVMTMQTVALLTLLWFFILPSINSQLQIWRIISPYGIGSALKTIHEKFWTRNWIACVHACTHVSSSLTLNEGCHFFLLLFHTWPGESLFQNGMR